MSSPYTVKHWIDKGFTEEQAKIEISKRRPSNYLYWMNKGYNEDDARKKVFEHQGLGGKSHKGNESFRKRCNTTVEYWMSKGFSKSVAEQKRRDRQLTFSLEKCIEKYGIDEGTKIWQERQNKWQKTLKNKPQEEIDRINKEKSNKLEKCIERYGVEEGTKKYTIKCSDGSPSLSNKIKKYGVEEGTKKYNEWKTSIIKSKTHTKFSKESMMVFDDLHIWLYTIGYRGRIFTATSEYNEYKLFENTKNIKRCFFYDFTLPELKIIIEYNGESFHPNPIWQKDKWEKWNHPFTKQPANEIFEYQQHKLDIAKRANFKVLEIWSSTSKEENIKKCKEFIQHEFNLFNITNI